MKTISYKGKLYNRREINLLGKNVEVSTHGLLKELQKDKATAIESVYFFVSESALEGAEDEDLANHIVDEYGLMAIERIIEKYNDMPIELRGTEEPVTLWIALGPVAVAAHDKGELLDEVYTKRTFPNSTAAKGYLQGLEDGLQWGEFAVKFVTGKVCDTLKFEPANAFEKWNEVEVQPVKCDSEGNCEVCEQGEEDFYSVYLHFVKGGVDCIADVPTRKLAEDLKATIENAVASHKDYGTPPDTLTGIDWELLAEQKKWLIGVDNKAADGLLAFVDAIQDMCTDDFAMDEQKIFRLREGDKG